MVQSSCPSCGAALVFRSSISVYAVCAYCQSMVVRTDANLSVWGKMAELPDDIGPLQIGTEAKVNGHPFTLVGRLRVGWDDGAWNEWFLSGPEGHAWLAEAQGFFAVSIDGPMPDFGTFVPQTGLPELGAVILFKNRRHRVSDIKQTVCIGSEGELPFKAPQGRKATYVDMISDTGGFASIEYSDEGPRAYTGSYVDFDDLHLTNLREIEGWKPSPAKADTHLDPRSPSAEAE